LALIVIWDSNNLQFLKPAATIGRYCPWRSAWQVQPNHESMMSEVRN
jgi:hypothetical protein